MIFIGGVGSRIKPAGVAACACPACGRTASLHITKKYSVVTLFFIPVIPFGGQYIATCSSCASVLALEKEKGRLLEKGQEVSLDRQDFQILQNNQGLSCSRCGNRIHQNQNYCPTCGERIG